MAGWCLSSWGCGFCGRIPDSVNQLERGVRIMGGCCEPRSPRPKMFSVGGNNIGVFGLDEVIREVADLEPLTEDRRISELLSRFRRRNYFPDSARDKYGEALLAEYKKHISEIKKESVGGSERRMEIKVLGPGCKNCKTLESAVLRVLEEMGVEASVEKVENPRKIVELGVMMTPGLIINGKIKSTGKVPKPEEISKWIREEMGK